MIMEAPSVAALATVTCKRPVFVVGSPRSGTSFLYHSLLSSGGFAIYDQETNVFSGLTPRVGNLANPKNRERLIVEWQRSNYFTDVPLDEVKGRILRECNNGGDFLRIVMENFARRQNVERWAEKTPDHVLYLREIKRTIPDALIIHIIRDGRDVALSLDKIGFLNSYLRDKKDSLLVCGLFWEWLVSTGVRTGPAMGPDYLEVHFEDLVSKPQETLSRIGSFIHHDLDYDRIQQAGIHTVRNPNSSFKERPGTNGFSPVNRWEKSFPSGELGRFEALLGPSLKKVGYQLATPEDRLPDGPALRRLGAYYRTYFSFRHWIKSHRVPIVRGFVKDR